MIAKVARATAARARLGVNLYYHDWVNIYKVPDQTVTLKRRTWTHP